MSGTGSVRGFTDFDDLLKGNQGYSYRLENLFNVCSDNKDLRHPTSFEESVSRVIRGVKSTLQAFEIEGKTISEFVIGKSFVQQRIGVTFRPDIPTTWTLDGGINDRWKEYKEDGYDGLVVLCCVEREMIPKKITENINFQFKDENEKNKTFVVDQQLYALALEQRLIHHFMFVEPDGRLRNHSVDCGNKKEKCKGGIVYFAYKLKVAPEEDEQACVTETAENRCSMYAVTLDGTNNTKAISVRSHEKVEIKRIIRSRFDIGEDKDFHIETQIFDTWAETTIEDLPADGKLKIKLIGKEAKPKLTDQQKDKRSLQKDSGIQAETKKKVKKVVINSEIIDHSTRPNEGDSGDSAREQQPFDVPQPSHSSGTLWNEPPEQNQSTDRLRIKDLPVGRNIRGPLRVCIENSSETLTSGANIFNKILRDDSGVIKTAISGMLLPSISTGQEYLVYNFDVIEISPYLCGVVIGDQAVVVPTGRITPTKRTSPPDLTEPAPTPPKRPDQEQKINAPKKSIAEKKLVLEEALRVPNLSSTKDYNIVFEQVLARKEHLNQKIRVYYEKQLESSKGRETLKHRVNTLIRDSANGKLMEKEKDPELIKLIHKIVLREKNKS